MRQASHDGTSDQAEASLKLCATGDELWLCTQAVQLGVVAMHQGV